MGRLYLDHNVSHGVMALLGREGHDVVSARDLSSERLPDDAQLLATVRSDRVFVTHNRADFKLLHDAWLTWPAAFGLALPSHPGILVLDSAPPATLAQVLTTFLAGLPPERLANGIFWWHRHDGWRQPIAGASWEPYQPLSEPGQE